MPKNKKNPIKKAEEAVILDEDSETPEAAPVAELDPEVLSVLENKKKKKVLTASDVDYVPELERDVDFSDTF
ncbi:hypothetical protein A2380_03210 [candidate division WWE3 bacterium RIFOXYB1_FULL_43_24]|uniref:Uncharacterized protein n=1 Tax=candidate division WWE3 bacterium GW2011_GWB1_42_6 TaxID=1619115 RepID=A0A0G1DXW8_UNCKA|nr:MAG: hypothetical protein UU92_C0009G0028 [candidate division WWE3 bacterium GW2011_GWA1_42_12]KKS34765.1 MAG: hypothetical protein UU97_C0006G0004 [candidate division WWE3 bacterium GW2011_GWD1_42_14]KKS67168.1 MAG: hypothetical protein UV35_C0002G0028 [candidate division WWE3 bacterium GW2011_GWB1_42_6]OGC59916.1 MAG: hypothetical protein A2212_00830 [candidate division WWE3 bacterium RIFOXYA1_FULL_42_9]OGC68890.1 MAG: hypothetical protein A2380_03210 [candidate division WWE3 bacterium RIF